MQQAPGRILAVMAVLAFVHQSSVAQGAAWV
jgi:hypothetical protein